MFQTFFGSLASSLSHSFLSFDNLESGYDLIEAWSSSGLTQIPLLRMENCQHHDSSGPWLSSVPLCLHLPAVLWLLWFLQLLLAFAQVFPLLEIPPQLSVSSLWHKSTCQKDPFISPGSCSCCSASSSLSLLHFCGSSAPMA